MGIVVLRWAGNETKVVRRAFMRIHKPAIAQLLDGVRAIAEMGEYPSLRIIVLRRAGDKAEVICLVFMRVHEAAIESGVKFSGCTVHFVDNQYDHGPIILQRVVEVREIDTPTHLQKRVFEQECSAYPDAIRLFAANCLKVEGCRVRVLPA